MKTIKELKDKLEDSHQPLKLVFEWVKSDYITYHEFDILVEHVDYLKERAQFWDSVH